MSWHAWRGTPRPPQQLELLRVCRKCGTPKPLAGYRHRNGKVHTHICLICERERMREWDRANPDKRREAYRRYHQSGKSAAQLRKWRRRTGRVVTPTVPRNWMTTFTVAAELELSVNWVRSLLVAGKLIGIRQGKSWRVDPESVRRYNEGR